ncbi:Magnesium-chelatase subunit H [Auxenochlorella protothecoides]|uniref:magnesium chelatase n=1 Tax=Auxenochlorella protothecoides TaxID=3075 RepID=A0A087STC1_AUXPR|nr:Magnesium-chelatase subunit H [Auxenochlorella protothecoides]KFM28975.1 Magnesium-chelatase subunit H [Auxenochlorella protothecoides]
MPPSGAVRAVLVVGFESFNAALYRAAGERLLHLQPPVQLSVFSDRDLDAGKAELAAALKEADVFFGSLLFDFDQVEWLKARIEHIPIRLVFESALELMSSTQMGGESKSKGPPPAVQKVLKLFGSKREEDKLVGYLSFLKIGPKLLKFLPGKRGVKEGVQGSGMFPDAARYMAWYRRTHPGAAAAPVVAVLLYRKHVVTRQPYLWDLVTALEAGGLLPLPIFINGVEAHVIVRDALTSAHEAALVAAHGRGAASPTLARDAVAVDAIVNTVGFPLVGGPAGTMEGGRQAEVARSILATKNVPYLVAAPLLIQEGYDLGGVDLEALDGEAIVSALRQAAEGLRVARGPAGMRDLEAGLPAGVSISAAEVPPSELKRMLEFPADWGPSEWGPIPFLPDRDTLVRRMEKHWGPLDSYRGIASSSAGGLVITGVQIGKVWIGIQPMLGIEGDPMRLLFDRDLTPHPQYAAFYLWLQGAHGAHAVLHFGMHGTAEWLPGSPLGSSALSWPDVLHGDMPNIYLYAANNPSESLVAKRRGFATVISHNVPPYGRAGLYKQLAELRELLADYREAPGSSKDMRGTIVSLVVASGLDEDVVLEQDGVTFDADIVGDLSLEAFNSFTFRLTQYLQLLEGRLFSSGLHVLGKPPSREESLEYLAAYFGDRVPREALERVAAGESVQNVHVGGAAHPEAPSLLEEAQSIASLLGQNGEELRGLTRALSGQWVQPAPGGDLLRDGPGVLPTGRNIFALDPYRMPSPAALLRGSRAAESILAAHREQNDSAFPETVAVNLWGLDAIKTKGESVAIVLHLVGARPVKEGTGRIARFELIPLEGKADALMWLGRPRIDVLCNMSGIFRDSFQNVVELLDDMFHRAAATDEPEDANFIRKHAQEMAKEGHSQTAARLFSNPKGDYGSMVNERVGASNWESGEELGDTWSSRNAFSYGRGGERGRARPEVLDSLLSTTDRVVQTATGREDTPPRELEEVLRLEYRSKLLNPRWAQAMAAQGSGGAFEISQRMTALLGWGATTRFAPGWAWDQAAETYALDPDMADRLREANPEAFRNLLRRCLEAAGRGLWTPGEGVLEGLQQLDADMDAELEGVRR